MTVNEKEMANRPGSDFFSFTDPKARLKLRIFPACTPKH
jgi:hypothetical protein